MPVKFEDFSYQVIAELNDTTIAWLDETASAVVTHAKRNTSTEGWTNSERTQLRGSYSYELDEGAGKALVGNKLEQAYWEEWGTGEHAAHKDGRKDWWIYIPGESGGGGESNHYKTREEAERMAEYIKVKYGKKKVVVTNGREPHYTLENGFKKVTPAAIEYLKDKLKGMGE